MRTALRLFDDAGGGVTVLAGIVITPILLMLAIIANLSLAYLDKRDYQSKLDLAALYMITKPQVSAQAVFDHLEAHEMTLKPGDLTVTKGIYLDDPSIAPENRFTPTEKDWNALKLEARTAIEERLFKSRLNNQNTFEISSIATRRIETDAWMGSRLLRVQDGFTGALLEALLGSGARVDVADYEALVDVDLDLFPMLRAINTEADLKALTYEDVLTSDITIGNLVSAIDLVSGNRTASAFLQGSAPLLNEKVRLSDMIVLGHRDAAQLIAEPNSGEFVVTAGHLLVGGLALANGENQLALDLETIGSLANVSLRLGDKGVMMRWDFSAEKSDTFHTEQMTLIVSLLGSTLSAEISLAEAEARIKQAQCAARSDYKTAQIDVTTNAAELNILLAKRKVLSLDLSDDDVETLRFNPRDIRDGVVKTTRSGLSVDVNDAPLVYRPIVRLVDDVLVALGLHLAEVDVKVTDVHCTRAYLVR